MFEKLLNCDPATDHLMPKDVLPIFKPFIDEQRRSAKELDTAMTFEILKSSFEGLIKDEFNRRVVAEEENHRLGG